MLTSNPEVANTNWQFLIEEIGRILGQDADKLERNIAYYEKLRESPTTDIKKLENIYERLIRERDRFFYFSEIYFRLQNPDMVTMMTGIENVFKKQEKLTGKQVQDYVLYFRKCQENKQVYYMPL